MEWLPKKLQVYSKEVTEIAKELMGDIVSEVYLISYGDFWARYWEEKYRLGGYKYPRLITPRHCWFSTKFTNGKFIELNHWEHETIVSKSQQ